MKVKTCDLVGVALDRAVAVAHYADGREIDLDYGMVRIETSPGSDMLVQFMPSMRWSDGGPIIEHGKLSVGLCHPRPSWATQDTWSCHENRTDDRSGKIQYGPTPLIAAMRCYVASKFGLEFEPP